MSCQLYTEIATSAICDLLFKRKCNRVMTLNILDQ